MKPEERKQTLYTAFNTLDDEHLVNLLGWSENRWPLFFGAGSSRAYSNESGDP